MGVWSSGEGERALNATSREGQNSADVVSSEDQNSADVVATHPTVIGGYEFGLEIESVLGKFEKTIYNDI